MVRWCERITHSPRFDAAIIQVILLASVLVGVQTYSGLMESYGWLVDAIDTAIIVVFVVEAGLKIGAQGRQPWRYFADPWNAFDFSVVVLTALPVDSAFASVFRLVRILRVLRLVKALPRLRLIVDALLKSFSAMGYVSLLLFLHFYIFATLGVSLFGKNDPLHFGSLDRTFLTLFQLLTLDSWVDIMNTQVYGATTAPFYQGKEDQIVQVSQWPIAGPIYFVVFVLLGTMIILNLFIGVITNSMTEAQEEQERELLRAAEEREGRTQSDGTAAPPVNGVPGLPGPPGVPLLPLAAGLAEIELQIDILKAEIARVRHQMAAEISGDVAAETPARPPAEAPAAS